LVLSGLDLASWQKVDLATLSQVMFALLVPSDDTHFNQQSLKQTAQVGRKTAKTVS